jgi:Ca-activated chloride channel family protein
MSGKPLEEAKRCAAFVVTGLRADDRASVVVYDDHVNVLAPANPIGDGEELRGLIAAIHSRGNTNLHGGWFKGAETLAPHAADGVLSRVILLSDGCANQGLTDEAAIAKQCAELAASGVTTSTYGLGQNFNESLMQAMARSGGGNAYYGATADDLMDPFREELGLLNSLVARRMSLHLEPAPGIEIEVLNNYESTGPRTWRLPDLAYGAEAWAVVRIRVSQEVLDHAGSLPIELLTARVTGTDLNGHALSIAPAARAIPAVARSMYESLAENELVRRRLQEVEAARSAEEARSAARRGDWARVDQLLESLRKRVHDSPWLSGVVRELEALAARRDELGFSKETLYASHKMRSRLAASYEPLDPQASDGPDYLRRKLAQGKAGPQRNDGLKGNK